MRRLVLLVALTFAASAIAAVLAIWEPWSGDSVRSATEVPLALPRGGVNINDQALLKPLSNPPDAALSMAEAIKAARHLVNAHPFPARALEARATLIGSPQVRDVPAWIVTFTSPKPVDVAIGRPGFTYKQLVTHDSIVLDAVTGKMLFGFFTK